MLRSLLSPVHRQRAFLGNGMGSWNTCLLMPCLCPQVTRQTIYIHLPDILYNSKATSLVPGSLTLNGFINSQARNTALTQFLYSGKRKNYRNIGILYILSSFNMLLIWHQCLLVKSDSTEIK